MVRIFFACDAHGSNIVWKKCINAATNYKADVVMLCGDLTGKAIIPVVKVKENEWYIKPFGKVEKFNSIDALKKRLEIFHNQGYYSFETTEEEIEEFRRDPKKVDEIFKKLMMERLDEWLRLAEERVPKNVKIIVSPGNDDILEIDEVIKAHEDRIIYPLKKVVMIDDKHPMISYEYVNPTPWETPRELDEKKLYKELKKEFDRAGDSELLICNFHAPPYDTPLDLAPKLDKNQKVVTRIDGTPIMEHVGSRAVRKIFEERQPLLGLHGHIHESPGRCQIGRTLCINPGSDYQASILRGYVIDMPKDPKEEINAWQIEG